MFRFDHHKINYEECLGRGGFATVYPYGEDNKWVVKVIECKNEEELLQAINEIVLAFNLDHPSVLPVTGYAIEKCKQRPHLWTVYLKLQRMETDLQNVINNARKAGKYLRKEEIISYFYDIVLGLEYLNKKKIAHRDLKPSNLLLDREGKVKLSDIGLANFVPESSLDDPITRRCGTQKYKAPELQNRENHIKKKELFQADIWSLGMILLDLCLLVPTFNPAEPNQTNKQRSDTLNDDLEKIERLYKEEIMSKLIRKYLLNILPSERMSIEQVKEYLEKNYHDILAQRSSRKALPRPEALGNYNQFKARKEEEEKVEMASNPQRSMKSESEAEDSLLATTQEMQAKWQSYFIFAKEISNELKVNSLKLEGEGGVLSCQAKDDDSIQMLKDLSASLTKNDGFKDLIDFSLDLK